MNLFTWVRWKTGLDAAALMAPDSPIRWTAQPDGTVTMTRWDFPAVPEPSAADLAEALAAPEPVDAGTVKAICKTFINGYASTDTQMNVLGLMVLATATADQKTQASAAYQWIMACRAHCASLVEAGDTAYAGQAATYPVPPPQVLAFLNSV